MEKTNPVAVFLAKLNAVSRRMLPIVLRAVISLVVIIFLVSSEHISVELMMILTISTIAMASFEAGMVWQKMQRK